MTNSTPSGVEIDGVKLRERRKLAGETITGFALRCGVHLSYISQIELGGRRTISPPVFARICDALGIPADERDTMVRPRASV